MTSAAMLKLLERATKRFGFFRKIGTDARALGYEELHLKLMEWWEPVDEALLKEMLQAINGSRGCEPLPFLSAATDDDDTEEVING